MNVYSESIFEICCDLYNDTKLGTIQLYPCVKETLELLKEQQIRLFIVTDASYNNAIDSLDRLEVTAMFDHVITADMTRATKPDMNDFYHALFETGSELKKCCL